MTMYNQIATELIIIESFVYSKLLLYISDMSKQYCQRNVIVTSVQNILKNNINWIILEACYYGLQCIFHFEFSTWHTYWVLYFIVRFGDALENI